MTGDRVLVYDQAHNSFFAGWHKQSTPHSILKPKPKWSDTISGARVSYALGNMQTIAKMLGNGAKVVSETKAQQLEAIIRMQKSKHNTCMGAKESGSGIGICEEKQESRQS